MTLDRPSSPFRFCHFPHQRTAIPPVQYAPEREESSLLKKIILSVSSQSYESKVLSGRLDVYLRFISAFTEIHAGIFLSAYHQSLAFHLIKLIQYLTYIMQLNPEIAESRLASIIFIVLMIQNPSPSKSTADYVFKQHVNNNIFKRNIISITQSLILHFCKD